MGLCRVYGLDSNEETQGTKHGKCDGTRDQVIPREPVAKSCRVCGVL